MRGAGGGGSSCSCQRPPEDSGATSDVLCVGGYGEREREKKGKC